MVGKAKELPKTSVDVIVTALEDEMIWAQQRIQPWHRYIFVSFEYLCVEIPLYILIRDRGVRYLKKSGINLCQSAIKRMVKEGI